MAESFLTFQKFNDPALAEEIAKKLRRYNITVQIEDNSKLFDPSFANNRIAPDINLKLLPADFIKAQNALEDYYKQQLDSIDHDYYLFSFTDKELIEIISKPDEWGQLDYQLAQKILAERGLEIKPELARILKEQRIDELTKAEPSPRPWIYAGYILAVFGAVLGIIIGCTLAYSKKTLPNGQRIYVYTDEDRNHGTRMLLIAGCVFVIAIVIRLFFFDGF